MRHAPVIAAMSIALSCPAAAQAPSTLQPQAASPSIVKDSRSFELRTYYAAPGKLEELHARFRNHTIALFKKHGMTVVGFWAPTAPPDAMANTLVYVLVYPSDEAREAAWKAFGADPDWIRARDASERNGKLVTKVESVKMKATDYSDMK